MDDQLVKNKNSVLRDEKSNSNDSDFFSDEEIIRLKAIDNGQYPNSVVINEYNNNYHRLEVGGDLASKRNGGLTPEEIARNRKAIVDSFTKMHEKYADDAPDIIKHVEDPELQQELEEIHNDLVGHQNYVKSGQLEKIKQRQSVDEADLEGHTKYIAEFNKSHPGGKIVREVVADTPDFTEMVERPTSDLVAAEEPVKENVPLQNPTTPDSSLPPHLASPRAGEELSERRGIEEADTMPAVPATIEQAKPMVEEVGETAEKELNKSVEEKVKNWFEKAGKGEKTAQDYADKK